MTQAAVKEENKRIAKEYKELLKISYQALSNDDKKLIRKAFDIAVEAATGAHQIFNFARHLDAGKTRANDDHGQQTLLRFLVGFDLGLFHLRDDVVAQE